MTRSPARFGLCGPQCRYRPLYEGSQASLSDMAAKQAAALSRVTRLRAGIVAASKQAFPTEFSDAEARLGKRMSSTDDEVLLAYLNAFLTMPRTQSAASSTFTAESVYGSQPPLDLSGLRAALSTAGVPLPASDDVAEWTTAVTRWSQAQPRPQVATAPPEQVGQAPHVHVSDHRVHLDTTAVNGLSPAEIGAAAVEVGDLFDGDVPVEPPGHSSWAADAPVDLEGHSALDGLEDLAPPVDPVEGLFDDERSSRDGVADLADLFTDEPEPEPEPYPEPALPEPGPAPAETGRATDPTTDPVPSTRVGGSLADLRNQQATTATSTPAAPAVSPSPAATPDTVAQPLPGPAGPVAAAEPAGPARRTSRNAGVVKPELFPSPAKPTKKSARPPRRAPRVSAAPPDGGNGAALAAAASGGELNPALREQLKAAVCLPRPVFTSDLAHMVGDPALIEAWEQECRLQGTAGPFRFIVAKPRHRERGNLVIPFDKDLRRAATEFDKSLWSKCLNESTLKGAKLYEVAVLLHRFGDQIVTADVKANTVTLRINQQRGLVGVVVVLDTDLDAGDETRAAVAAEVEELLASRLTLLAVVTYTGGPKVLTDLADALRAEAEQRSWSVTAPVIVSHSWDFASDGGTSAISVLG